MKFDLVLWANSGDQIQVRTLHRTKRERERYLEYTLQGIQLLGCVAVLKNSEGLSYLVVLR